MESKSRQNGIPQSMSKSGVTYAQDDQLLAGNITTTKRMADERSTEEFKQDIDKLIPRSYERKLPKIDQRMQVKGQAEEIVEKVKLETQQAGGADLEFLVACLQRHFVFYNLAILDLEKIVSKMFYCTAEKDQYIFKQGDDATCFFIIVKGKVEVSINNKVRKELSAGSGFGDLALLYNAARSASIKAVEKCYLYGIKRSTFKRVVQEMMEMQYEENRKFIEGIKFFDNMTHEQKDAVASAMISQKFNKDENILNEGDLASSFYIIQEGAVVVNKEGEEIRKMGKGDSFGEQALYYNTVRSATVKALTSCKCLALGRDTLTEILGSHIQVITLRNQQIWAFDKSSNLSQLTKIQMEKVADRMKVVKYKKGGAVYEKGSDLSAKIVILHDGHLIQGGKPFAIENGVIGDKFLLNKTSSDRKVTESIVAEDEVVTSEITLEELSKCIGGSLSEILVKNERSHEKRMSKLVVSDLKKQADSIQLDNLVYYKKLGFGQFGSVYLVKDPKHKDFMALKCVSKQKVIETELETHIKQEKMVMEKINFPFIVNLIKTFKDQHSVYFLEQYVKGMELFDVIRELGVLNKSQTQFYVAQLLLCIEYLHGFNIIYRDLKPENVMIDHKGYVKMIDMGTAKILQSRSHRTFTTIGTPHYMAPEVIIGRGYGLTADLWSVGVCLYEFMCARLPFGEEAEDPQEVCEEILSKPLKFPSFVKDLPSRKMMSQLINKLPEVRLGSSFASLKAHPWFEGFDWDLLMEKELPSPYVPPAEKLISTTDVDKATQRGHKVTDEIKIEQKNIAPYRKEKATNPNWDAGF